MKPASIRRRLRVLESALARSTYYSIWDFLGGVPIPEGFDPLRSLDPRHLELWHRLMTIPRWLAERDFPDALAALETGETGPAGLADLLREEAAYDQKCRDWACLEKALAAGELPERTPGELIGTDGLSGTLSRLEANNPHGRKDTSMDRRQERPSRSPKV